MSDEQWQLDGLVQKLHLVISGAASAVKRSQVQAQVATAVTDQEVQGLPVNYIQ